MQVYYYLLPLIGGSEAKLLIAKEYYGPIERLQLNSTHVAVLIKGVPLHVHNTLSHCWKLQLYQLGKLMQPCNELPMTNSDTLCLQVG